MNCFSADCQILSSFNKSACIDVHIGLCWCGALFCARTPFVSSLGNILYMLPWSQAIGLSVATLCQWQAKKTFITVFEVLQLILCTLPSLPTKCTWGCFHCESTLKKKKIGQSSSVLIFFAQYGALLIKRGWCYPAACLLFVYGWVACTCLRMHCVDSQQAGLTTCCA